MDEGWNTVTCLLTHFGIYWDPTGGGEQRKQHFSAKEEDVIHIHCSSPCGDKYYHVFASKNLRSLKVCRGMTLIKLHPPSEMITWWNNAPWNRQSVWNSGSRWRTLGRWEATAGELLTSEIYNAPENLNIFDFFKRRRPALPVAFCFILVSLSCFSSDMHGEGWMSWLGWVCAVRRTEVASAALIESLDFTLCSRVGHPSGAFSPAGGEFRVHSAAQSQRRAQSRLSGKVWSRAELCFHSQMTTGNFGLCEGCLWSVAEQMYRQTDRQTDTQIHDWWGHAGWKLHEANWDHTIKGFPILMRTF